MSIEQRLTEDMKQALRSGDKVRLSCVRMLLAKLKERHVELRVKHPAGWKLDDEAAQQAIASYAKQRRDSIRCYEEAGRTDLAEREQAELAIIQDYLPRQLGEEELRELVRQAITACGAASTADLGAVMREVLPRVQGQADGKQVNRIARELLGG